MQIFEYLDYRQFLRDWLQERRSQGEDLTFAQLAEDIGMQRPAFSKVLNGDSNFNTDQTYLLGKRLNLSLDEEAYLNLLLERERSGLAARKEELEESIFAFQRRHISTPIEVASKDTEFESERDRAAYFSSPWTPIIHVFLTIPKYQADVRKICEELDFPAEELERQLALLEKVGLISRVVSQDKNGKRTEHWMAAEKSIHSMDLSFLPAMQQLLFRSVSMHRLSVLPLTKRYGLSVAFSADGKCYEQARQILVKAVTEIHGLVSKSEPKQVFHLSLDMFPWEKSEG